MKNLVSFLYEIGILRQMKRSYYMNILQDTESIAEHSHRAMVIAYLLAKELDADASKAMLMAAFHDMAETRTGDSNWVQKPYVSQDESKALDSQFNLIGKASDEIKDTLEEYKKRESLESQIAKDADYIEYFLSLRELELAGNKEAHRRLNSENTSIDHMFTDKGKEIAKLVKEIDPTEWTQKDLKTTHKQYMKVADKKK